jgi:hypothetical protein
MPSLFYEEYFPVLFFFRVLIYSILLLRFYIFFKCVFDAMCIYRIIYPKWFLNLGSITFLSFCFFFLFADFGSFTLLMEDSSKEVGLSAEHQAAKPLPEEVKEPEEKLEEKPDVHRPINMGEADLSIVTRGKDTYICSNSDKAIDNKFNDGSYVGQVRAFCSKTFKNATAEDPFNKPGCVLVQRNDEEEGFDSSTDPYRLANAHTQGQSVYVPDPRDPKLKNDK